MRRGRSSSKKRVGLRIRGEWCGSGGSVRRGTVNVSRSMGNCIVSVSR